MSDRDDLTTLGDAIDLPLLTRIGTVYRRRAKRVTWHNHHGHEFIFMLEGEADYEFRQHPNLQILGNSFLAIPAGADHRGVHDVRTPSTICGLLINPKCHSTKSTPFTREDLQCIQSRPAQLGPVVCPFGADLRAVLNRLIAAHRAYGANRHSLLLQADFRLWVCAAILGALRELGSVHKSKSHELVAAAEEYLKQHFSEPIYITDLVRHIGMGHTRLSDLFKTVTGHTPHHYLLCLRVEKAKELLVKSEDHLTEIAMACGFSSGQHFSTMFLKWTGQTPREYRRKANCCISPRPAT